MKIVVLLFLFFTLSLNAESKKVSLVLPWKHQFQFAGYYMAKEKGFYKEVNLQVDIKEFNSTRSNVEDVASLKANFGVRHSKLILDIINNYPNLKLLAAINQSSPLVLIAKKSSNIKSLQDIKNRDVMMSFEDNTNAAIIAMLQSEHIYPNDFNIVTVKFDLKNFIDGDVNFRTAFISNEPYQLKHKGIPFHIYNPKDYGYDFYSDILFTSDEFIKKDPQTVQDFTRASLEGWEYAYAHIDESIEIILKHYNTQHRTKEALKYEAETLKKLAFFQQKPLGNINADKLEKIANTYHLLGLTKDSHTINFNQFIYKIDRDMNKNQLIYTLHTIYKSYKAIILFIILVIILIPLLISYFNYRLKMLLYLKTYELKKNYEIVNKNVSISKTDILGNITYVSKAFCKTTGYTQAEILGKNHRILKDNQNTHSKDFYKKLWETISSGNVWQGEFKNLNKDGTSVWVSSIISPIFNQEKKITGYQGIRRDINIKKVLEKFNEELEKEVQEQTKKIKQNEQMLDTLFNITPHISYVLKNSKIQKVNRAFLDFMQFNSLEEFLATHQCICKLSGEALDNEHCTENKKITLTYKNYTYTFVRQSQKFIFNNEEIILVTLEDITVLEKIATTDKLTTLFNRVKIEEDIETNFNYYIQHNENFSLIMLDIDYFKNVNDTYGHLVGDEVLKLIAKIMKESVRSSDSVGRWGGEEFMIICPNTHTKNAIIVAQEIRKKVEAYHFPRIANLTISCGVCDIKTSTDSKQLIKNADTALYKAKNSGRNRVESI